MKPISHLAAALLGLAFLNVLCTPTRAADFTYTTYNGTIVLIKYIGSGGDVAVPATIDGLPVADIGNAFNSCTNVTSVTLPDTVTHFGYSAFYSCSNLTNVVIPNTLRDIGDSSFQYCVRLSHVTIPDSVTNVGGDAFYGCLDLADATIGKGTIYIGGDAFQRCTNLVQIIVDPLNPAFTSSQGVLFDKSQTTIIRYPAAKDGGYSIPDTVTNIENRAFKDCVNLRQINFSTNLAIIGTSAFEDCLRLPSVTIPISVSTIGPYAFIQCLSLTNFAVAAENTNYSGLDGVLFNYNQTTLIQYPPGKDGSYAIPGSVTDILYQSFAYCAKLTSVVIPNGVTSVGFNAFAFCGRLPNVSIPDSVTLIDHSAFSGCTNLTNVAIGRGVTRINDGAFFNCTSLSAIDVDVQNPDFCSIDGVLFDKARSTLLQYCTAGLGDYSVPPGVTTIDHRAFFNSASLTRITIPDTTFCLVEDAFDNCLNLSALYCEGNAPYVCSYLDGGVADPTVFSGSTNVTVYYLPGRSGWSPTFSGRPTAPWVRPAPIILSGTPQNRNFAFTFRISWATNVPIVIEACTDLAHPAWLPIQTNSLSAGSFPFFDFRKTNYSSRYYRVRSN